MGHANSWLFTASRVEDATEDERSMALVEGLSPGVKIDSVSGSRDVAKVSIVGIGMRSHAGVAADAFQALASRGINIQLITTSEIKISVLIDAAAGFTVLGVALWSFLARRGESPATTTATG